LSHTRNTTIVFILEDSKNKNNPNQIEKIIKENTKYYNNFKITKKGSCLIKEKCSIINDGHPSAINNQKTAEAILLFLKNQSIIS
jgi:hypothetical protein